VRDPRGTDARRNGPRDAERSEAQYQVPTSSAVRNSARK
jgi:hypothetical protein